MDLFTVSDAIMIGRGGGANRGAKSTSIEIIFVKYGDRNQAIRTVNKIYRRARGAPWVSKCWSPSDRQPLHVCQCDQYHMTISRAQL